MHVYMFGVDAGDDRGRPQNSQTCAAPVVPDRGTEPGVSPGLNDIIDGGLRMSCPS